MLASASPRRLELFRALGREFGVDVPDIDESPRPGEPPFCLVRRLAAAKAVTVGGRHPLACVVGADTVVALAGEIFGKPRDRGQAKAMLARLSGQTHQVFTGIAVWRAQEGRGYTRVCRSDITFRPLSPAEIAGYVATGESMDKAGAYAIQGGAGRWVENFRGSREAVIGLPTDLVRKLLAHWEREG